MVWKGKGREIPLSPEGENEGLKISMSDFGCLL